MSVAHLLEDFSEATRGTPVPVTDVMLEDQKLAAFEKGYQAGWDDSAASQKDAAARISADFAQNIRDLSFTYQEAHGAMLSAMRPLLQEMVEAVLPVIAHDTLGIRIADLLHDRAAQEACPVMITVAADRAEALRDILPEDLRMPLEIRESDVLADGQINLRIGSDREHQIDLSGVLAGIRAALDGFFHTDVETEKETA